MHEPHASPHSPREALVQTKQKWALTLLTAWGAMSCGSAQSVDAYQGAIDASRLDAKFKPVNACGDKGNQPCYPTMKAFFNGEERDLHNLGLVEKAKLPDDGSATKWPLVKTSAVTAHAYDLPDACTPGKAFDERTDAYRRDEQYSVLDALPVPASGNTPPPVFPLVLASQWTGVGGHECNAIKSAQSLKDGVFGGSPTGEETLSLRAVVDVSALPIRPSDRAFSGWYQGLQLAYLDGGPVGDDGAGNVRTMDGLWIKPATGSDTAASLKARLVFQARPGESAFSPVVRLREIASTTTVYTSLCYTPPCAADAYDMTQKATPTGVLFIVPSPL
jgi:hypothetical protein